MICLIRHLRAWATQGLWKLTPEEAGDRFYEPPRRVHLFGKRFQR